MCLGSWDSGFRVFLLAARLSWDLVMRKWHGFPNIPWEGDQRPTDLITGDSGGFLGRQVALNHQATEIFPEHSCQKHR
jgi:hypothetical protein